MDRSAFGERLEDGMQIGITKRADISDFQTQRGKGMRHDRTIATQFGALVYNLDISALARRPGDAFGETRDCWQPGVFLCVFAFVHSVDDFIDEAIQSDKRLKTRGPFN